MKEEKKSVLERRYNAKQKVDNAKQKGVIHSKMRYNAKKCVRCETEWRHNERKKNAKQKGITMPFVSFLLRVSMPS